MRVQTLLNYTFLVAMLACSQVRAQEARPTSEENSQAAQLPIEADKPAATLLVEETPNNTPGESMVIPPVPELVTPAAEEQDSKKRSRKLFKMVYGSGGSLRLPVFVSLGGRLGISASDNRVEAGIETEIGNGQNGNKKGAIGYFGSYLALAPIPGEIGKRIYLRGKVFRAYSLQKITDQDENYLGTAFSKFNLAEYGIGYRHFKKNYYGEPDSRYFYVELSLVKPFGDYCDLTNDTCSRGSESGLFDGFNSTIGIHFGYGHR